MWFSFLRSETNPENNKENNKCEHKANASEKKRVAMREASLFFPEDNNLFNGLYLNTKLEEKGKTNCCPSKKLIRQ